MKKARLVLLFVSCVSLLGGCGGGASGVAQSLATHFSVAAQGNAVVGTAFNITVTALDASNNTVTTYSGSVRFASSDAQAVLPAASSLANGTGTFSVTLMTPGSQTITATDTVTASIAGGSNPITVTAVATHFSVTAPASATTGIAFNFTLTALDASNNGVATYSGTVHFISTDPLASLPANSTLTNGVGTFSATLKTLGAQTVTATDTVTASITGTSSAINVGSATATHFSLAAPSGWNPGSAFNFTVKALDAANNVAPAYSGTVHFSSTDAQAALPADSTLTNGAGTFSATLNTVGGQTITATDTVNPSLTGTSNSINVQKYVITSGPPPNGTVGVGYGPANCPQQGFELRTNVGTKFEGWSGSSLPPGLQITKFSCPGVPPIPIPTIVWLLHGTPTQAGTFSNVIITASDPFHGTTSATYTITINPAAANRAAATILNSPATHHHYKLVDLGTLGGPQSYGDHGHGAANINSRGVAAGVADTAALDPSYPSFNPLITAFGANPHVFHAFVSNGGPRVDLGALPGANSSSASFITDNGLVAGQSLNGTTDPITGWPEESAVVWSNGQIINLGSGGGESAAGGVNSRGQVAGFITNNIPDPFSIIYYVIGGGVSNGTQTRGFIWDQKNGRQDLGTLGGSDTFATLINELGQVAGSSYTNDIPNQTTGFPTAHVFIWENGKMIDTGSLGGTNALPDALNNKGEVVGFSNLAGDTEAHAFLWRDGNLIDVGTLGGTYGEATTINEAGDVAGIATTAGDTALHAFFWKQGVITDLGPLPNYDSSCVGAFGINSGDQVVGQAVQNSCAGPGAHAFLWENGDMVDLNVFVPPGSDLTLVDVETINDRGEMFGGAALPNGDARAFLLIPCDENHPKIEGCDYSLVEGKTGAIESTSKTALSPDTIGRLVRSLGRPPSPGFRGLKKQSPK